MHKCKITKPFTPDGVQDTKYFGLGWEEVDGIVYALVPDEFLEDYVNNGRVLPPEDFFKKRAEPVEVVEEVVAPVEVVTEMTESAEEVVEGTTEKAVEKKATRKSKSKGK